MHTLRRHIVLSGLALVWGGAYAQPVARDGLAELPFAVRMPDDFSPVLRAEVQQWLSRSSRAVVQYFGRFPAPQATVTLLGAEGSGVRSGLTFDGPPPGIRVTVGHGTTREQFLADWIMVHEMVHLAVSQMPRRHTWFHEGVATYVEIIARARAGLTTSAYAWEGLTRNLHHGLPLEGEQGMDGTRRWGRTYWGGALFFLLCDLDIRQRTQNRLGLQDALAGIVRAGSNYGERWPLARTLAAADAAVGTPSMSQMYARFRDEPVSTDLEQLWRELGLRGAGAQFEMLADAPRADARRAILPE